MTTRATQTTSKTGASAKRPGASKAASAPQKTSAQKTSAKKTSAKKTVAKKAAANKPSRQKSSAAASPGRTSRKAVKTVTASPAAVNRTAEQVTRLEEELAVARKRIVELEALHEDAVNRIDWVIDSLQTLLSDHAKS
jgi:hypothetical protein